MQASWALGLEQWKQRISFSVSMAFQFGSQSELLASLCRLILNASPILMMRKHDWILEKCCDTHFTKAELEHLQTVNFTVPVANIEVDAHSVKSMR
eukprot:6120390-Amphidinium_carterae.1